MKALALLLLFSAPAFAAAVEGYDYESGSYVELDTEYVKQGMNVDMYDYDTGDYHDVDVEVVQRYGRDVEVYDNTTGEYRTIELQ